MNNLKSLTFCSLLIGFGLISHESISQCDAKISFEVKSKKPGLSTISMKCTDGSKSAKIQLYDLNVGKVVGEVDKIISSDLNVFFDDVKPSVYAFHIWFSGCKKPIIISGEKVGVTVEN